MGKESGNVKTEHEIKEEIEATEKAERDFIAAFKDGRIDALTLERKLREFDDRKLTLRWVLE